MNKTLAFGIYQRHIIYATSTPIDNTIMSLTEVVGHRITLLVGAVLHFFGYLGIWLAATGLISPPYWQVLFLVFQLLVLDTAKHGSNLAKMTCEIHLV